MAEPDRPLRADAARNRARVLEVAYETFAAEGLSRADRRDRPACGRRRRHRLPAFPRRRKTCSGRWSRTGCGASSTTGTRCSRPGDPGEALFAFLRSMVLQWGATDRGLADALAGVGHRCRDRDARGREGSSWGCSATCCARRRRRARCGVMSTCRTSRRSWSDARRCRRYNPDAAERLTEVVLDGLRAGERPCTRHGRVLEMQLALATGEC